MQVRTLLGSCVSVVLWHPTSRVGAMSHFLLWSRGGFPRDKAPDGRYGDEALMLMIDGLAKHGVDHTCCHAKVFGGGDMFAQPALDRAHLIGEMNGRHARKSLAQIGVNVVSQSLFGYGYRHICFDLPTGNVFVRHVESVKQGLSAEAVK